MARPSGPPRVAFLGTRGVPAAYGGFETFVDQLGRRLAQHDFDVTVYCRSGVGRPRGTTYAGMKLVVLPAPRWKYLETVVHGIFSAVHALWGRYDLLYLCNVANVPAAILLLLGGRPVALNVDGLEWDRKKWGLVGRTYYRGCAWIAAKLPVKLVTDAMVIATYYRERFGRPTVMIPYGSDLERADDDGTLARLGLEPGGYVLYVSRFEPENNALAVIRAYRDVPGSVPLVMVGDAPYATEYIERVRSAAAADARVRLTGAIYGRGYAVLQTHALCYLQATEIGGTHPALVEAMGRGVAIVANDVPEHREVLADTGLFYRGEAALCRQVTTLIAEPSRRAELAAAARLRAEAIYSWDSVAARYERWFGHLLGSEPSQD